MSPFAIEANCGLLYCGSEGKTAMLMAERLTFINGAANDVGDGFYQLIEPWQSSNALQLVNDIFISETYLIQPLYKFIAEKQFLTKIRTIDFHKLNQAQTWINDWVADDTNNMITSVIEPGLLNRNTPMVSVSGLNFKNKWTRQFNNKQTTKKPFYKHGMCGSKTAPLVPMMHMEGIFNYAYVQQLDAEILQLPLLNSNVSLYIVKPTTCDGFSKLDHAIPSYDPQTLFHTLSLRQVNLQLPKFKVRSQFDLKRTMSQVTRNNIYFKVCQFVKQNHFFL